MARIRKEYKYGFTTVSNEMYRDNRLSLKDRGLLGTMLSLPDYWDFSIRGLASMLEDGVTAIGTSLRKLEETGYLKRTRIKKGGKIVDWEYSFSDSPIYKDEGALLKLARTKKAENDFRESINHQDPLGENQDTENLNLENEERFPDVEKPYVENQDTENLDLDHKHLENLTQLNTKELNTKELNNNLSIHQLSIYQEGCAEKENAIDGIDEKPATEEEREEQAELIKDNIGYEALCHDYGSDEVDEIVSIMTDVTCSLRPYHKLNKDKIPAAAVKSRFLQLNQHHIACVLDSLRTTTATIRNPYGYILTALWNSKSTMNNKIRLDINCLTHQG